MSGELAQGYVGVKARMDGVQQDVSKEFDRAGTVAGQKFSQSLGRTADVSSTLSQDLGKVQGKAAAAGADSGRSFSAALGRNADASGQLVKDLDKVSGQAGAAGAESGRSFAAAMGRVDVTGGLQSDLGSLGSAGSAAGADAGKGFAARFAAQSQGAGDDALEGMRSSVTAEAQQAGDAAGGGFVAALKEKSAGAKDALAGLLEGDGALFTGIGLGIGGFLASGFSTAMEQTNINATLTAQLGLTKDQSAAAGKAAGALFAGGYGEGMEQISESISTVIQNIDGMKNASDSVLEGAAAKALTLSQVFGQDLEGSTAAVSQMLRTGLATSADQAFDILTVGLQNGTDKADDLLDTFVEYSTQFRKLGIDGTTAMGLLSQGLKGGARDADLVADAIKEFAIRAVDGSTTTAQGFTAIGLSAQDMTSKLAAGGSTAKDALGEVLTGLRGIPDPAARSQAAVALFGTQAEDLGDALYKLDLGTAAKGMGQIAGATDRANNAFNATPQAKMSTFFREVQQGAVNIVGGLLVPAVDGAADAMSGLFNLAQSTGGALTSMWSSIPGPAQDAVLAIGAVGLAQKFFGDRITSAQNNIISYIGTLRTFSAEQTAAGLAAANLAGGMERSAQGTGAFGTTADGVTIQLGRFGTAVQNLGEKIPFVARLQQEFLDVATTSESSFPRMTAAARAGTSGLKAAGAGLVGALGGPWGLALAGAGVALTLWQQHQQDAAQKVAEHKSMVEQLTSAIEADGGAIGDATRKQMADNLVKDGAVEKAAKYGISLDTLSQAAMGNQDAISDMNDALTLNGSQFVAVGGQAGGAITTYSRLTDEAKDFQGQILDLSGATKESLASDKAKAAILRASNSAYIKAGDSASSYKGALKLATDAQTKAKTAADNLKKGISGVNNAFLESEASSDSFQAAIDSATDSIKENGKTLDENTEKGRANRATLRDIASTGTQYADSLAKQGASATTVADQIYKTRKAYVDAAVSMGENRQEAEKLAAQYIAMPTNVTTTIQANVTTAVDNLRAAQIAASEYGINLDHLPQEIQTKLIANPGNAPEILKGVKGDVDAITRAVVTANGQTIFIPSSIPNAPNVIALAEHIQQATVSADSKSVTIAAAAPLAPDVIQKLRTLYGAAVTADGKSVTIPATAITGPALSNLQALLTRANLLDGKVVNTYVNVTQTQRNITIDEHRASYTTGAQYNDAAGGIHAAGGARLMASGGIAGALARRQPMTVGAGSNILWGEGKDKETYLPWDRQYRDRALDLAGETLDDWGYNIVPKPVARLAAGAATRAAAPSAPKVSSPANSHDDASAITEALAGVLTRLGPDEFWMLANKGARGQRLEIMTQRR